MSPDQGRREVPTAIVASLLSVLVTALAFLAGELSGKDGSEFSMWLAYTAVAVALVVLATLHLRVYLKDLNSARVALGIEKAIVQAVPTLLSFATREDILTLHENGDAELEWRFDLKSAPGESVTQLAFPIYAEGERQAEEWTSIEVKSIEVAGRKRDVAQSLSPMEHRVSKVDGRPSLQYALLKVPVELSDGSTTCPVRIVLTFKGVFPQASQLEAFYIDVPYLTQSIMVQVAAPGRVVRQPVGRNEPTIDAMSALMETRDLKESAIQNDQVRHVGDRLVWEAEAPKLGYRYKLYFRVEDS